jgi:hypothetical protein
MPAAAAAVPRGPTVAGRAPAPAPLTEDWDCEEERAMAADRIGICGLWREGETEGGRDPGRRRRRRLSLSLSRLQLLTEMRRLGWEWAHRSVTLGTRRKEVFGSAAVYFKFHVMLIKNIKYRLIKINFKILELFTSRIYQNLISS